MESLATLHHCRPPLRLSLHHLPPSLSTPISSVSFRSLPPRVSPSQLSSSSFRSSSIRASSSPSESFTDSTFRRPRTTLPQLLQTLNSLFSPVIRTTCTVIAAAALFYTRLHHKPVIAAPLETPTVESMENTSNEENQRAIDEKLSNNPNDTDALRSLIEVKVRARKIEEVIQVIDRLIELEPEEFEWPLLKAHMYVYNGDYELARVTRRKVFSPKFTIDQYCGYQEFGLICVHGYPVFLTLGLFYLVTNIDYDNHTLRLVDYGTFNQTCLRALHSVPLGSLPLSHSPLNLNLSFYYDCSSRPSAAMPIRCLASGVNESFVFVEGNETGGFDWSKNCGQSVMVMVMKDRVTSEGLMNEYKEAMNEGFVLDWQTAKSCVECEASDGLCGYSNTKRSSSSVMMEAYGAIAA